MSVVPNWRLLRPWRIPIRLRDRCPEAVGKQEGLVCWKMGEGAFQDGPISDHLYLRTDPAEPEEHGYIEPIRIMLLGEYEAALTATRDSWTIDEE